MIRFSDSSWVNAIRKPTPAILVACLLLVIYIAFLTTSNYRNQAALRKSTLKQFRLDMERRAASLGYFFSERKYDLRAMASSREITAYFTGKALGMSEQYGLKVNLFVIGRMLGKTLQDKVIQGDDIYTRFLLVDRSGKRLVDTAPSAQPEAPVFWQRMINSKESDPVVFFEETKSGIQILIAASCIYKNRVAGCLIAWMNLDTLFSHFVDSSLNISGKGFALAIDDGRLICAPVNKDCFFSKDLTPDRIARFSLDDFSSFTVSTGDVSTQRVIATRMPIHNHPLDLLAWVEGEEMLGSLTPWELLLGTGFLALVILLGIWVLMRFNAQNIVLKDRFQESEHQQALLTAKNKQLMDEISRRQEAEKKLEEQRTLRIRSDRLRSLGEMAAGIAHELNQPLVGVRGLAELILSYMESGKEIPETEIRNNISRIVEQADRMVHIINHIRLFAREAGSADISLVDLNDVVQSGAGLLKAQFRSRGLQLETHFAPDPLPIRANPFSVEEVILNLMSNAHHAVEKRKQEAGADFTPSVRLSTRSGNRNGNEVSILRVSDNGGGIAPDIQGKVFDPFFTTKDPDKGTGLGLSICKSIVEEFGGTIDFRSTEGKGTTFTIEFIMLPATL